MCVRVELSSAADVQGACLGLVACDRHDGVRVWRLRRVALGGDRDRGVGSVSHVSQALANRDERKQADREEQEKAHGPVRAVSAGRRQVTARRGCRTGQVRCPYRG